MLDLTESVRSAWERGERAFLATVVSVEGSAYRHEGAKLLVLQDGTYQGMISGGCLEPEIAETTARLEQGATLYRHFDLRDDSVFGLGMGCGGMVGVLIEEIQCKPAMESWIGAVHEGRPVIRALLFESSRDDVLAGGFLVVEEDRSSGSSGDPELDEEIIRAARQALKSGARECRELRLPQVRLLLDVSLPPPRLVLFGAGDDTVPVAGMAGMVGFEVDVVDGRSGLLTAQRFPGARLLEFPPEDYGKVELDPRSYVVIMHHHVAKDAVALARTLEADCGYVGLLGPPHRFDKVSKLLPEKDRASSAEFLARVDTPVGLDIGAQGPEEIALSIVARLVEVRRSRRPVADSSPGSRLSRAGAGR